MRCVAFFFVLFALNLTGSAIETPSFQSAERSYQQLACTKEERAKIAEIITTVAEKSVLGLAFKKSHLDALGAQIDVHPLKFLSVIIKDPKLKSCMAMIWRKSLKRNSFVTKFSKSLSKEADAGRLARYLEAFSEDLQMPKEDVEAYCKVRDWESFISYLIHTKIPPARAKIYQ